LIQIADLFGQHGVSFLVAMTNGLAVDLLTWVPWRRPAGRKRLAPAPVVACALWAACMVGAWSYGRYRLRETAAVEKDAATLRIAVVQTNVPQDNKDAGSEQQRDADWSRMLAWTARAGTTEPKPDLIVWPETMVPQALNPAAVAHYREPGFGGRDDHGTIAAFARSLRCALLVGADAGMDWQPVTLDGEQYMLPARRYNAAYLYHPDGSQDTRRYDKIHRVPFGEYIPWTDGRPALKKLFLRYLSPYGEFDYSIEAGARPVIFDLPGHGKAAKAVRFATPICFEDAMPHVCREMVYGDQGTKRADVLINLTNDGWFAGTDQPWQQLQIAAFRCVENRVPMARSVNTGISGFIDAAGRVTRLVKVNGKSVNVEGWAAEELRTDPRRTLFGRIGHAPIHGMMAATAALCLFAATRKRRA
jgi:apolipoprotein N-acyltransferase